jgi:transposase InsO family protein
MIDAKVTTKKAMAKKLGVSRSSLYYQPKQQSSDEELKNHIATVMDLYTREILGWQVAWHHTTDIIVKAFEDAVRKRQCAPYIFHSDQGSEYVSGDYAELLRSKQVLPSFSRKSSPWENGHQESWNGHFKLELGEPNRFIIVEHL